MCLFAANLTLGVAQCGLLLPRQPGVEGDIHGHGADRREAARVRPRGAAAVRAGVRPMRRAHARPSVPPAALAMPLRRSSTPSGKLATASIHSCRAVILARSDFRTRCLATSRFLAWMAPAACLR